MADSNPSGLTPGAEIVLLCGVGTGNVGNDASFATVRAIIESECPGAQIVLATPFVDGAQQIVDVPVVALRQDYTSHLGAGSPWRIALSVARGEGRRLRHLRLVQRRLSLIVVSGTGIFDDFSENPWNMPYALLTWALFARWIRRPFAFLAVGAGPVHNALSRRQFAIAARLATSVSYRDEASRDFMSGIGAGRADATVVPDVVFAHPVPAAPPADPRGQNPTVGVGVMAYGGWTQHGEGPVYEAYIATLAQLVTQLIQQGCGVRFLAGQPVDLSAVEDVIAACEGDAAGRLSVPEAAEVADFAGLLEAAGSTDLIVATRYHNIVAALMMRRPVVSLSYAPKNAALLASLDLENSDRPVEEADAAWISARIADIRAGRAGLTDEAHERLDVWGAQVGGEVRTVLAASALVSPSKDAQATATRHRRELGSPSALGEARDPRGGG